MACGSCGGGRSGGSSYTHQSGSAESWRLTYPDGAQVFYTDPDRAQKDHDALKATGATLEKINPITGAPLPS